MKISRHHHHSHHKHHKRPIRDAIVDTVSLGATSLIGAMPVAGGIWGGCLAADASYMQGYKDRITSGNIGCVLALSNFAGSLSLAAGLLLGNQSAILGGAAGLGLAAVMMGALTIQVNHTAH